MDISITLIFVTSLYFYFFVVANILLAYEFAGKTVQYEYGIDNVKREKTSSMYSIPQKRKKKSKKNNKKANKETKKKSYCFIKVEIPRILFSLLHNFVKCF